MDITPQWQDLISEILADPGVVLVVGAIDSGKTSFCLQLCNAGVEAGIPTAVVDADVGQSEIGAPGTIGMSPVVSPVGLLSQLKPRRLYFVGATSPAGHIVDCTVGTGEMVDFAEAQGAKLVIVDTTGLVQGPVGRKLKTSKISHIKPKYLVGIQKRHEIDHIIAPFAKMANIRLRRAAVSEQARHKPPEMRAGKRQHNFYKHFHDADGHIIHLEEVSLADTWLRSGRPMKWQYVKTVEDALKCRVLHAEILGDGIYIVTQRSCSAAGRRIVEEQFRTRNIMLVPGDMFQGLLVGLADENGVTINVGLVQAIDFRQKYMFVLSPIRTISPVKQVRMGTLRLSKDGKELGKIRPGDI